MSVPTNKALYEEVKKEIYAKYPKHSAYRSGLLVQEYKKRGGTYEGTEKQTEGLNRWFLEKWKMRGAKLGTSTKTMCIGLPLGLQKKRLQHSRN